jgi:hypothetical protein
MKEIRGWFDYHGITTQQHEDIGEKLTTLFETVQPSQILEIGTACGGLTVLMRNILNQINLKNCLIRSYDVNPEHNRSILLGLIDEGENINFRLENIFNSDYSELKENSDIPDFIRNPGVTIVMCDGGSKLKEVNILSKFLKKGDIIMAHDYSPTTDFFEENIKGKVWNWHELEESDIQDAIVPNNLIPFLQEDMQEVVWMCKIRS